MNTPPRLMAVDPSTQARHLVFDPNPGVMTSRRFAKETVLHWQTKAGAAWVGGIYWPVDYVPGKRYPLVIQTHGFDSTGFWPDGIFATGEAAQPLAGRGVVVVQMSSPPGDQWVTPREGPLFEEGAEGLIDHLDSAGVIDRTKVGMQGFSRTCYYTLYFLTHSSYRLAAATLTDGVDVSYMQHMIFQVTRAGSGAIQEDEKMIGGPPYGAGLALWRERAPGFNLDHVTAPVLLTALQSFSLLEEWEPYAGLLLQGKPTELWYIPDAEHILTKPWERLTSQQGAEDWFRFWLQGAERDGAPAGQYARWRAMRVSHTSS
jgi:dipeptidyl aminopeptidase/acylaminoacyl peptidase